MKLHSADLDWITQDAEKVIARHARVSTKDPDRDEYEKLGLKRGDALIAAYAEHVEADYLVTGDDPMNWAPTQATSTPSPQQQILLDSLKKQQEAFGEATDLAQRLHIPELNLNRFLSLMGFPQG